MTQKDIYKLNLKFQKTSIRIVEEETDQNKKCPTQYLAENRKWGLGKIQERTGK